MAGVLQAMSDEVQGAIVGGLIGLISGLIGAIVGPLYQMHLSQRGEVVFSVRAEQVNPATDGGKTISITSRSAMESMHQSRSSTFS
jgi:hypothetical protein